MVGPSAHAPAPSWYLPAPHAAQNAIAAPAWCLPFRGRSHSLCASSPLQAFFGLTSLGTQAPFKSALLDQLDINIFDDDDFKAAFTAVDGGSGVIGADQLPAMLEALCRGPAPAHVVGDFMEFFQGKSQISWQDLDSGIEGIKGTVRVSAVALPPVFFTPAVRTPPPAAQATRRQESSQVAVEFTSGEAYRANLKKHTRMAGNPDGKYAAAATSAQTVAQTFAVICVLLLTGIPPQVGWQRDMPGVNVEDRKPKQSCEETLYADAMVKSGVYF